MDELLNTPFNAVSANWNENLITGMEHRKIKIKVIKFVLLVE